MNLVIDLEVLEDLSENLMTIKDIALILSVDENNLREAISNPSSKEHLHYNRGKLKTKLALRKEEISLAKAGSPLAMENSITYMEDMNLDEL